MSSTIAAVLVLILSQVLPLVGVSLDNAQITGFVQTAVAIAVGLWVWYQRTTLQKAPGGFGDVNAVGVRRKR